MINGGTSVCLPVHRRSLRPQLLVNTRAAGGLSVQETGRHRSSPGKEHKSQPEITKMCQRQQDAGALQPLTDTSVQTADISDPRSRSL